MTKILVCGADGFMGTNIARYFAGLDGFEVFGTVYRGKGNASISNYWLSGHSIKLGFTDLAHLLSVDLTKEEEVTEVMRKVSPDIVIQAAAVTSGSKDITERPYIHVTDSTVMNTWLLRAAYEYNVKHLLYLSCGIMYQPGDVPRKETDFNEHDEIFKTYFGAGWMKVFTEKQCEFYSRLGRTKHTIIRHTNTYGTFDKYDFEHSHFFGATVRKVMDAEDGGEIVVWGTGEETARDLVYVDDVVDFMRRAIVGQVDPFVLCNVSAGVAYTVKEVVEEIVRVSGKNLKIVYDTSKPSIPTKLALDWSKAAQLFGWAPCTSLTEGIQKTLDWYKEYYVEEFL